MSTDSRLELQVASAWRHRTRVTVREIVEAAHIASVFDIWFWLTAPLALHRASFVFGTPA